jgi:hypothetical protein
MAAKAKRYRVVGGQPVVDGGATYYPGEEFTATFDTTPADFFVGTGALKVVEDKQEK